MSLPLSRYNTIRERLIFLHNILQNRTYVVYATPKMLMSLDQLRDRTEYSQENVVGDSTYYDEYQERKLTIPKIIEILPNLISEKELGFRKPNTVVVEIYESIQEYLRLWVELNNAAPEFKLPPIDELRNLELMAYTIFNEYKRIKHHLNNRHRYEKQTDSDETMRANLLGLGRLLGMAAIGKGEGDEISFISYLDDLYSNNNPSFNYDSFADHPIISQKAVVDSLSSNELGEWVFKG